MQLDCWMHLGCLLHHPAHRPYLPQSGCIFNPIFSACSPGCTDNTAPRGESEGFKGVARGYVSSEQWAESLRQGMVARRQPTPG